MTQRLFPGLGACNDPYGCEDTCNCACDRGNIPWHLVIYHQTQRQPLSVRLGLQLIHNTGISSDLAGIQEFVYYPPDSESNVYTCFTYLSSLFIFDLFRSQTFVCLDLSVRSRSRCIFLFLNLSSILSRIIILPLLSRLNICYSPITHCYFYHDIHRTIPIMGLSPAKRLNNCARGLGWS